MSHAIIGYGPTPYPGRTSPSSKKVPLVPSQEGLEKVQACLPRNVPILSPKNQGSSPIPVSPLWSLSRDLLVNHLSGGAGGWSSTERFSCFSDVFRRSRHLHVSFTYNVKGKQQDDGRQQNVIADLPTLRLDPESSSLPFDIFSKNVGTLVLGLEVIGHNTTQSR